MNGIFTASSASRSATLVWVRPAGLNTMNATWLAGASWIRAISSASALLWNAVRWWPASAASWAMRSCTWSSVTLP